MGIKGKPYYSHEPTSATLQKFPHCGTSRCRLTEPGAKLGRREGHHRGAKRARLAIDEERVLKA